MPTWIKRIFNMIIEYTSDISNLITNKADLVDGKVPAEQLPSYVDDVIEFNNLQVPDTQISIIVGNNSYKNQIRFINGSSTSSNRIGSEDKYSNMFVNFGENTSEDDWTTFEPEKGKIYVNTTNNHSYRWSGSYLIDLDFNWSQGIKDLQENTVRTDSQDLSVVQQKQAFENLGWKVHVISKSAIGSSDAVSDDEKAARLSATALLVHETGVVYNFGVEEGGLRKFFGLFTNSLCNCLFVDVSSGAIATSTPWIHDQDAVSFSRNQSSVSDANKNKALGNIGIDFVRLPYSLLGTTLSDEMANVINNARGIILVNTPNDFILPTIYNKGRTTSSNAKFITIGETKDVYYILYNKNTKALATIVHDYTDNGCVRYIQDQSLTDTQKDTVLSNIGLKWVNVPYSLLSTTLDDATYTKIKNAYGIILTDVPSDYFGPREFICGSNNSDGTKVFAGLNLANTSAYIVLYVNHNLTNVRYARSYDGAVPYDTSKTLTSDQQDVALSNIGLNFVHVDYSLLGTTITDEMFAVLDNAKGIILVNLPSNYNNPFVFIKGNNTSTSCIFVGFATGTTYCQIKLDKSTKILSNINANLTYVGTVRYIEKQSLTDTQKQQARSNIGATSCYDEYKLAGGTKYTTEADFNAQLVKVMDMTVVE